MGGFGRGQTWVDPGGSKGGCEMASLGCRVMGSVMGFEEAWRAEGLVGEVMGEMWWECWCPRGFGASSWSGGGREL